jgi:gluconolactonase
MTRLCVRKVVVLGSCVVMALFMASVVQGQESKKDKVKVTDADLSALVEPGRPKRIATGLGFAEGPVWHPAGYFLFSDIPNSTIYKWTPYGKLEKFRSPSYKSNGLTVDREGRLIACENANRRVSRTEADGTIVTLADRYDGKRLNSPNDVVVKSDGSIYFTDPPYGLPAYTSHPDQTEPGSKELSFCGVYKLSPDGNTLTLVIKDFRTPNGLAFSPDEKILYVADTEHCRIKAFDVKPDGTLDNGRIFAETLYNEWPDGIKTDTNGDLYVATNSTGVRVYNSTGKSIGVIVTDSPPANCAFGGPDGKTLFIAARESVYAVRMKIPGVRAPDR